MLALPDTGIKVPGMDTAAYSGKVVLIIRGGGIPFSAKVKTAQDHGAVAVVVYNNIDTSTYFAMDGEDATITIPSIMITQSRGETLRAALAQGSVDVTMKPDSSKYAYHGMVC